MRLVPSALSVGVRTEGWVAAAGQVRFRVVALDPRAVHMSLPVLKAIRELIAKGAVVWGPKPTDSPSLADDTRVYPGLDLAGALDAERVSPDFSYTMPKADTQLLAVHRLLKDGELYFVDKRNERAESLEMSLRTRGRVPELWHAETGRSEPAARRREGDRTIVPLNLGPWEAVFVVLRKPTLASSGAVPERRAATVANLDGPWQVNFQAGRHAPATSELPRGSWSEYADDSIKYFAGTGSYRRMLEAPANWLGKGAQLWLDLGDVRELAEVIVNGQSLGVAWRPPYRMDISSALHVGSNTLDIAVTDLCVNRLIRDAQPDVKDAFTFTQPKFYKGKEPLVPAGLIGPVRIERLPP